MVQAGNLHSALYVGYFFTSTGMSQNPVGTNGSFKSSLENASIMVEDIEGPQASIGTFI